MRGAPFIGDIEMTSPVLSPKNTNYTSPFLTYNQMNDNQADLTLDDTMAEGAVAPTVILDGTGRVALAGQVIVDTATLTADMPLATLPGYLTPQTDGYFPVAVLRDDAPVSGGNVVKVESGGAYIASFAVDTVGLYESIPTGAITGPGEGATFTMRVKAVVLAVQTAQSSTGSYAPGDTLTGTGGTGTQFIVPITHTKVVGTPTVAAAGASGTPGTATVTGTTGTGTKFQATVTISGGGAISSVDTLSVVGDYTVNPTLLTAEPVTGGGLVGATLAIHMGVLTLGTISVAGAYTVIPTDPITTTSSGSGTGCTLNAQWGLLAPTLVLPGTGYTSDSAFVVSGGGEVTPGAVSINLGASTNGLLTLMIQPQQDDVVCLDGIAFLSESY